MNRLIVLNHQPTVPPFMVSALKVAVTRFDEVLYVNKRMPTNVGAIDVKDSIKFVNIPSVRKGIAYVLAFMNFLSPKVIKSFVQGIREKGGSLHYFKVFFAHLLYYWSANSVVRSILQDKRIYEETYLLSVWYGAEAYCASRIRSNFSDIKAASLAHSFEIFTSRDPHIPYYFNDMKLQKLDAIYFISKQGFDSFFSEIPGTKRYEDKAKVIYMGTDKDDITMNPIINKETFNICTCSRTIPLKRLDVLCEALRLWDGGDITWTHIGFGEDDNKIRTLAEGVVKENPKVKIVFKGRLTNAEVLSYYSQSQVDLFVNLSTIEGLPVSIMEVLSFGIPVVATDVGGTREIVDNKVGVLLPAGITPKMVVEAISSYYYFSDEIKKTYRTNAYEQWSTRFNAKHNFTHLFEVLKTSNC